MKKLLCLMVVMLVAVSASASTWVGTYQDSTDYSDPSGGGAWTYVSPEWGSKTTAGDGVSWFDVDNWATDATWSPSPALDQGVLPSSTEMAMIYGATYGASGSWGYGPAMADPLFNPAVASDVPNHPWRPQVPVVIDAPGAAASDVHVGVSNYNGATLNVTSAGTLDVTGILYAGQGSEGSALNNAGDITIGDKLFFNGGTDTAPFVFTMTGGTMDIANTIDMAGSSAVGFMHLDGGTVEAAGYLADSFYNSTIDITEGVLILDGDWIGELVWNEATGQPDQSQSWGVAWWTAVVPFDTGDEDPSNDRLISLISAYDGAGTIMYDYDITNPGQTTIWASPVPEPATMVLLGLGAVLLRRRK